MSKQEGINAISKAMAALPTQLSGTILKHIHSLTDYEPVIGIMGKTGVGKSSLCNALFHGEVSPVSDVAACTREPLRFRLRSGNNSLMLMDLPGVGESEQRDREYDALYQRVLPELDLILWVIKADDRALSVDERFYRRVMNSYRHRVLFVVNQADKTEPCHEWDTVACGPSPRQRANLEAKRTALQALFTPSHPVCLVSARTGWSLETMVDTMMSCLPDRATSPLTTQLHRQLCTEPVKKRARDCFGDAVGRALDTAASSSLIPAPLKTVMRAVRDTVVSVARAVWDWIFF